MTGYRWRILALVFVATTVNYLDRSLLSVLAPVLQYRIFHWSDSAYAAVTIAFQVSYALGVVTMGSVIDRLGTRRGYTLSIGLWSLFDLAQAAMRPAFGVLAFPLARFGFGFGQAGAYPAGVKSVAEWFPRRERALATGIFNAGSNMGPILASVLAAWFVSGGHEERWRWAFVTTGAISAACALAWWWLYRRPSEVAAVSRQERDYIAADAVAEAPGARLRWRSILPVPETWAFASGKLTDIAWWFYAFWTSKFLFDRFGLSTQELAAPIALIFILANVGSVGGGWLSSHLLKRGWSLNAARKGTLLLCACLALPVALVGRVGGGFHLDAAALRAAGPAAADLPDASVRALSSRSFGTAREFLEEADRVLGPEVRHRRESALLSAARDARLCWVAVLLVALAASAHQAWSATIFTFVSDVFPKRAVASVAGFGGMVGSSLGAFANLVLGRMLTAHGAGGYAAMFLAAGSCYLVALVLMHLLSPRLAPVALDGA